MEKYNITFDIFLMETVYEVEAENEKEAIEKAKIKSDYRNGEFTVFEVEKL